MNKQFSSADTARHYLLKYTDMETGEALGLALCPGSPDPSEHELSRGERSNLSGQLVGRRSSSPAIALIQLLARGRPGNVSAIGKSGNIRIHFITWQPEAFKFESLKILSIFVRLMEMCRLYLEWPLSLNRRTK
jgi:hypothetical protein